MGEVADCRHSAQKASAVESLARRLGRKPVNRGKHPMWESAEFPRLYPLSIPHHGAKDLSIGTRNSILEQLEDDVAAWERVLDDDDPAQDDDGDGDE
jgi:hypothetical protein